MFKVLRFWFRRHRHRHHRHGRLSVKFYIDGVRMAKMNLKDSQSVVVSAMLEDAKGAVVAGATFDAPPVWGLDDASFGAVMASADGLSATFTPGAKLGVCHITFSAALAGKPLVATSPDINVVAGDATQVQLSVGTPTP